MTTCPICARVLPPKRLTCSRPCAAERRRRQNAADPHHGFLSPWAKQAVQASQRAARDADPRGPAAARHAVMTVFAVDPRARTSRELRAMTGLPYYVANAAIAELLRRRWLTQAGMLEQTGKIPPGAHRRERLYQVVVRAS